MTSTARVLACSLTALGICACASPSRTAPSGRATLQLARCAAEWIATDSTAPGRADPAEARGALNRNGQGAEQIRVVQATTRPHLLNAAQVSQAMLNIYPADLRDRGKAVDGSFAMLIDPDGRVLVKQLKRSTGYPALDRAAAGVFDLMRFYPATFEGCRIAFWGEMPVTFEVR